MHKDRVRSLIATIVLVGWTGGAAGAQQTKPDNSAVNKQDRSSTAKTADQQSNDKTDLEITREIRRAIVADKSLSTYAHNIKVITTKGKVTLRGPVRSEAEKAALQSKADAVAGAANVTNDISIASSKASR